MGSDWKTFTLEELASEQKSALATGPFGSAISSKFFQENGIPVIRGGNLSANTSDRMSDDGLVFVSEEKAAEFKRSVVRKGDLIFTCWGTINQVGLLDEQRQFDEYIISNKQMKVTLDVDKADPLFVYYMFSGPKKQKEILQNGIGAAVPGFNLGQLREHKLTLPNINKQRRIASYLDSLDQKITLNNQINQTLEQMAQTLFKSWFVDFDPVKTKMNGEQPKGMDAATASLFPEKLVESELGLIPEGWEIHKTQDLFDVKDGTHDSPKKAEEGHYLVTSKHITKGKIDTSSAYQISDADFEKVNQRSKVDTFDILLTMIGTVGEVVVVYDNPVEFAIKNVGLFKTSQKPELVWLFYWHLQSFKMKHYLEARMAGTTQQYLTLKTLRTIPVVLPSDELLAKFNEVMSPLMEKISDNHKQSHTLSNLRDTLLPKLLSGEIDLENLQVEQANALAE